MNKPKPHPMKALDDFAQFAETLAGMRAQLIAQGFTETQAGELVVLAVSESLRQNREAHHGT